MSSASFYDAGALTVADDYPDEERYVTFGMDELGRVNRRRLFVAPWTAVHHFSSKGNADGTKALWETQ